MGSARMVWGWPIGLLLVVTLGLSGHGPVGRPSEVTAASAIPAFDHIFVVLMENHSQAEIIGNTAQAPYLNQLANQFGLTTSYTAVGHPSLPNYLALVGADTFGITTDCTTCFVTAPNLVADRVVPSGRTWKGYMESMPAPCTVADSPPYVQRHDPFVYFDDIRLSAQCANVVPYANLATDLGAASTTPNYVWITPNMCNDMHDCPIATGDTWLSNNVPAILDSPAFTTQNSLLLITWDEDDSSQSNQVATLVVSPLVPAGFRSPAPYTHYSLVRTIEDAWGLTPLGANDSAASAMADFFATPPSPAIAPLGAPTRLADTRTSGGPIAAGAARCFAVAGQAGIPTDAAAVGLNVTAVGQAAPGWLTVYPNGQPVPATSTVNFDTHEYAIANGTLVRPGTAGQVCVTAGGSAANVVLDATSYVPSASSARFVMLAAPRRLIDTRAAGGPLAAGASRCVPVAGVGGIPADVAAVVLNLTVASPPATGWLTLYPDGQPVPSTSTLNFDAGSAAVANGAMVRLGPSGQVCVAAGNSSANFVIDSAGYIPDGGLGKVVMLAAPQRVVDTRAVGGPLAANTSRCFAVAGQAGVAPDASLAMLNMTAVSQPANGWLTVYPNGQPVPGTSTSNFDAHELAIANNTTVQVGSAGEVCVCAGASSVNVVLDVTGYEVP